MLTLLTILPQHLLAQKVPVGDPLEEYARVLQLVGQLDPEGYNLRPIPAPQFRAVGEHPWERHMSRYGRDSSSEDLRVVSPVAHFGWASTRPAGGNDGFLWQGRGLSTTWHAGVFAKYSFLTAAVRPGVAVIQNANFDVGRGASFQYFGRENLDAPRRFGEKPLVLLHPGESFLEASLYGAAAGISTENMWWGPAARNPIVMSNNAPGFGHLYLRTSKPIKAPLVDFNAKWFWGNLFESKYFDSNDQNDRRFITGIGIDIQPRFIPNFYIGATRVFVQSTDSEPTRLADLFIVFQTPFKVFLAESHDQYGFDKNDQIASAFARWLFPQSGFEVYGEIARGDHNWDFRHVFVQLQFSTGYTLGFNKVFQLGKSELLRVNLEVTRLEASKSDLIRTVDTSPLTNFYVNTIVRQGYTHRGQLMGAAIGPGSNSQNFEIALYNSWGKFGWHAYRNVYDNDLFYAVSGNPAAHQVEVISGFNGLLFLHPFEVAAGLSLRRFLNVDYEMYNDLWNVTGGLELRWSIGEYR